MLSLPLGQGMREALLNVQEVHRLSRRGMGMFQRNCTLRSGVSLKPEPIFYGFMNGHDYVTFEDNLDCMTGIKMRNDMYQT